MLGVNLFLLQVLNLKLSMSLALRKVSFKLQMPEWLLFASCMEGCDKWCSWYLLSCCCSRIAQTSSFACSFYCLRNVFVEKQSDVTSFVSESVEQARSSQGAWVWTLLTAAMPWAVLQGAGVGTAALGCWTDGHCSSELESCGVMGWVCTCISFDRVSSSFQVCHLLHLQFSSFGISRCCSPLRGPLKNWVAVLLSCLTHLSTPSVIQDFM